MSIHRRVGRALRSRPLKVCAIGFKALTRLIHSVAGEFEGLAEIEVIDGVFERSLEAALDRERSGSTDVFISAGANVAILRGSLSSPVAAINVGGFDVWLALLKARATSERIGIVTYGDIVSQIEMGKELLRVELAQRSYRTIDEARDCFAGLVAEGYRVIVGSSVIVDMAEQHGGVRGILTYTAEGVRQAFADALELARVRRLEADRFERVDAVLQHLHEAVISVDREGRVTAINPAMESLLGVAHDDAVHRSLDELAPGLALSDVIQNGEPELGCVIWLNGANMVGNRVPVREHDVVIGALLTLQDAGLVQRADSQLRTQKRPRQLTARYRFSHLLGESPLFVRAKDSARRYAGAASTVLITGESGTGKELFAQAIHNDSGRRDKPFVAINCAAFPEPLLESELFGYEEGAFTGSRKGGKTGLFEAAHTGTVFLDEIGDMPLALQTRLLRVLQEKEIVRLGGVPPVTVDVRVIAATHRPLLRLVEEGRFRGDLYYRLNILQLRLPALRDRRDDIPLLSRQLLQAALRRTGSILPAEQALAPLLPRLCAYGWPGNVRELENIIERLAVHLTAHRSVDTCILEEISADFPEFFGNDEPVTQWHAMGSAAKGIQRLREPIEARGGSPASLRETPGKPPFDKRLQASPKRRARDAPTDEQVLLAMRQAGGNRIRAAVLLGIGRTTLWRRLLKLEFQT